MWVSAFNANDVLKLKQLHLADSYDIKWILGKQRSSIRRPNDPVHLKTSKTFHHKVPQQTQQSTVLEPATRGGFTLWLFRSLCGYLPAAQTFPMWKKKIKKKSPHILLHVHNGPQWFNPADPPLWVSIFYRRPRLTPCLICQSKKCITDIPGGHFPVLLFVHNFTYFTQAIESAIEFQQLSINNNKAQNQTFSLFFCRLYFVSPHMRREALSAPRPTSPHFTKFSRVFIMQLLPMECFLFVCCLPVCLWGEGMGCRMQIATVSLRSVSIASMKHVFRNEMKANL